MLRALSRFQLFNRSGGCARAALTAMINPTTQENLLTNVQSEVV